jgi:uncharacterized protein (TIGR03435 family)
VPHDRRELLRAYREVTLSRANQEDPMRKLAYAFALLLTIAAVLLLLAPPAHAQTAASLTFDVVSIKQNHSGPGPTIIHSLPDSDQITIVNASPHFLIGEAYGIRLRDLIAGVPAWADSDAYDIEAKVAPSDLPAFHKLLPMQRNPMLQSILADRFHLKVHFETRTLPAYALVVSKSGPKLKQVEPGTLPSGLKDPGGINMSRNEIKGTGVSMVPLRDVLQMQLGRAIVDRTGLTGRYSFTLQFTPAQASSDAQPEAAPSIFTAVQEQLGLRLEPVKAPVQVLVVDHIEKPSEN